jgi:hypothetical protein
VGLDATQWEGPAYTRRRLGLRKRPLY